MPRITIANGPENFDEAEERARQQRLEQEAQNLESLRQHRERRAEAVEHELLGIPTAAQAEQERLQTEARAAYAEQRRRDLAQARGEAYEPPTAAVEPVDGTEPAPVDDEHADGPTAA